MYICLKEKYKNVFKRMETTINGFETCINVYKPEQV
jgi:hypothetical protein